MYTFLARQPIFDKHNNVFGYELLYRNGDTENVSNVVDGNMATKNIISDAVTLFGLDKLTNSKLAFINFTENLILENFPLLVDSKSVVVELLEDIKITPEIINSVIELKKKGYKIALDDYIGDSSFDPILPYADIIKVDFLLTDKAKQKEIAENLSSKTCLLAEKVETLEVFEEAKKQGYSLFQGYYFSHPCILKKKVEQISHATFASLMNQLSKPEVDFKKCSDIISTDTVLTYKLLKRVNTAEYYSNHPVTQIQGALVRMGVKAIQQWLVLIFSHTNNTTVSDELIRIAFLRGLLLEEMLKHTSHASISENGFILGMFSLLDKILDDTKENLLKDIELPAGVKEALLGTEKNIYYYLLEFIDNYENQKATDSFKEIGLNIPETKIYELYAKALVKADKIFNEI